MAILYPGICGLLDYSSNYGLPASDFPAMLSLPAAAGKEYLLLICFLSFGSCYLVFRSLLFPRCKPMRLFHPAIAIAQTSWDLLFPIQQRQGYPIKSISRN